MNYGLPHKFKWVCTDTGRECPLFELEATQRCFVPLSDSHMWGLAENSSLNAKSEPLLYQSIGLTARKGVEVYFGDILYLEGEIYEVMMRDTGVIRLKLISPDNDYHSHPVSFVDICYVVGNRHTPEKQLQENIAKLKKELEQELKA